MTVLCAVGATLAACQSEPIESPNPPGSMATSSNGPSVPPTPGPAEVLAAALGPLDAASEFDSIVTVDAAVATSLTGRTVGTSSSLTVTTEGRTVDYLRVPPSAWAREPGQAWLVVDAAQTPTSPLAALAAPITVERVAGDGATTLKATYAAAVLGLEGGPVTVTITIVGAAVTFQYVEKSAGHTVVSTTILRPASDTSPIATPAG
jgi:hypothetical protein